VKVFFFAAQATNATFIAVEEFPVWRRIKQSAIQANSISKSFLAILIDAGVGNMLLQLTMQAFDLRHLALLKIFMTSVDVFVVALPAGIKLLAACRKNGGSANVVLTSKNSGRVFELSSEL
jgi:hypothetical protein